ncbi:hypothetical protein SAMN05192588_2297 [Nonlabens sp. Hel1_33_55]|uniref:O-antigen ligase family protein n=1 Tax=Nonlabens sp. Hel1_33_55 TaxID=1336802 RepID=UPI000875C7E3|nr:O-antigen ligase family protein [Nonlabens sp. Hel1_33_55]SCY32970.1 hypothetical protein SAMN05192588_2297 [Nonlabens sp. Hel1_33_55]
MKLNRLEKIYFYICTAGFAMPILPSLLRNIIIVGIAVMTILCFFDKRTKITINFKLAIMGSALYLLYGISLFYTENLDLGIKKLETAASLILLPLFFSGMPDKVKNSLRSRIPVFFSIFITSVALAFIIFFCIFWEHYGVSLFQHFPTVIDKDLGPYNIHPIYLSMHGAIAILMSLHLLTHTKSAKEIAFLIICNIIIAAFMLILIKKGPILSLVIAGFYYVISAGNTKTWTVLGIVGVMFASAIIMHPKVNSKFSELLRIGAEDNIEMSSTNIRMEIYKCGKGIIPQAGMLGFGVGDAREKLLDCYQETNGNLALYKYNSHNQYLSIILRAGFIGLIFFAIYMIYLLFGLIKVNGHIAVSIIVFYLLVMFSENILERENGVVYFSYLSAFLFVAFTGFKK